MRRLLARGLIAKITRTRGWRLARCGCIVMGTPLHRHEHHIPDINTGVAH